MPRRDTTTMEVAMTLQEDVEKLEAAQAEFGRAVVEAMRPVFEQMRRAQIAMTRAGQQALRSRQT